ncbi:MAG: BamA/TamA family outer membrane protein [Vicinamibacterales bacterium]
MLLAVASPVVGQTAPKSRAEALWQQREEKQRTARPYQRNRLESVLHFLEEHPPFEREGLFASLGSLATGSGLAYGGGYRGSRIFDRHGMLSVWGSRSVSDYWAIESRATFRQLAGGRLHLEAYASKREYPREYFFGLGPASRRIAQAGYLSRTGAFGGKAGVRPTVALFAGGGVEFIKTRIETGRDDGIPAIERIYDEEAAPGVSRQPGFIKTSAFVELDYRQPKNARKGGWYRVNFGHFVDQDLGAYSFNRLDVDLEQFVSFLAERRVLVGRIAVSTSDVKAGQSVPFYLMPTLGGNDSLRGFRDYRFRGPHAILLQGEYRWEIWSGLGAALFYDAGKVALTREALSIRNLEHDYGFGFRFNTNNGVVLRIDAGFGSRDGKHLFIVFGSRQ